MSITAPDRSPPGFVALGNDRWNENSPTHRTLGPDALRCPELHDFSDLRDPSSRVNRPLIVVLAVAAVLTIGHFVTHDQDATPTPIAQRQTMQSNG
jgi:hypothetical protein